MEPTYPCLPPPIALKPYRDGGYPPLRHASLPIGLALMGNATLGKAIRDGYQWEGATAQLPVFSYFFFITFLI